MATTEALLDDSHLLDLARIGFSMYVLLCLVTGRIRGIR